MTYRLLPITLLALALVHPPAFAATQPAGADTLLATFDGGSVTRTEFSRIWANLVPSEYPPGDQLERRKAYLPSIVDRKLLEREAAKHPIALTPAETAEIDRQSALMIQNALFAELIKGLPAPTHADLDLLDRQLSTLADVRLITFTSRERASSWRSRLISGTPASALDAALARDGATLATADSFRLVASEQIPDTLAQVIWQIRPGQVSQVLDLADGPVLVQLRKFVPRPGASSGRSDLEAEFEKRRVARIRQDFRRRLIASTKRTFDEEGMAILLKAHRQIKPRNDVDSLTGVPVTNAMLPLPQIAPADTGHALAHAGGRTFTIGDYLVFWGRVKAYERPEVRDRDALEGVVDRIALAPEIVRVGREHGLEKDPRYAESIQRLKEGFALDHYYHDEIESKVKVDEAGVKKLFESQPGHYDDRPSITSHIIVVARRSLADSLLTRLKEGASFAELAKTWSDDGESGAKGGDVGTQYRGSQKNVGLEDAMYATEVGKIGGPEFTPQGWVIWRIDAKTPGMKRTFDQARDMVERDYKVLEAERILEEKLVGLRKEAHVKMYPERITADLGADGMWGN